MQSDVSGALWAQISGMQGVWAVGGTIPERLQDQRDLCAQGITCLPPIANTHDAEHMFEPMGRTGDMFTITSTLPGTRGVK